MNSAAFFFFVAKAVVEKVQLCRRQSDVPIKKEVENTHENSHRVSQRPGGPNRCGASP